MTLNVFRFTGLNSALALKAPVRCAATTNITLTGLQVVDGVILQSTDTNLRVLVMGQTDSRQNGLYDSQSGNWTRCTDFDTNDDIVSGTQIFVNQGAVNQGMYVLTSADPVNLTGTPSNITFARSSSNVSIGVTQGSVLFANASGGITQDNSQFFWDDTNHRLGIGTAAPGFPLDILSPGVAATIARIRSSGANRAQLIIDNQAGGNQSTLLFNDAGVAKWQIGDQTDNSFFMFDSANSANFLTVTTGGIVTIGESGKSTNIAGPTTQLGAADAASPVAQTLQVQSVIAGTSNVAGATTTFRGSLGTGTGSPGPLNFAIGSSGNPSANTQNIAATLLSLVTQSNQGSDATNNVLITPTWNTSGNAVAVKVNVTNTGSGAASLLIDLQVGSTSQFHVEKNGSFSIAGIGGPSTSTGVQFSQTNNNQLNLAFGGTVGLRLSALEQSLRSDALLAWSSTTDPTATNDTGLSRVSANVLAVGNGSAGDASATLQIGALKINTAPTAVTHSVTITAAADSTTNFGHVMSFNFNGTTYYVPCGSVQP